MSWGWSEILQTCLTLLQAASERLILNPENSDGCGVGDGTPCILYFQELEKNVTLPDGWVIEDLPHLCGN